MANRKPMTNKPRLTKEGFGGGKSQTFAVGIVVIITVIIMCVFYML